MKEGDIYLNNKKVYLQKLNGVWNTYRAEEGWKILNRWDIIQSIIENIMGTCQSLDEVCEDHNIDFDELDFHELTEIDNNIFCCDFCGWWYETSESCDYNGEQYCTDDYEEVTREDNLEGFLND